MAHDNVKKCNSARKYDKFSTKVLGRIGTPGVTVDSPRSGVEVVAAASTVTLGVPRIHSTIECFALTEIPFRDPRLESISRQESLRQAPPPTHKGNSTMSHCLVSCELCAYHLHDIALA